MSQIDKTDAIKQHLTLMHDIRFNVAIGLLQIKSKGDDEYTDVTDDKMREICKVLKSNGIKATKADVMKAFDAETFKGKREANDTEELEMYLETVLETRFNEIKQKPEIRMIGEEHFEPLSKYSVNSLNRQLKTVGLKSSVNKLNELFFSDFSPICNPVTDYLLNLPEYTTKDGDPIRELCDTVQVSNGARWYEYMRKWLTGVVANTFDKERCLNHTMIVLTGTQGKFKTTWLNNLCPKELNNYLFCGQINTENKDIQTNIAECFLINVDDQLHRINKKDENSIKNMITVPKITYRRPYDIFVQDYPHLASFMGSVNGNEFLTDPTGNRRFLPFEALDIDIDKAQKLDMSRVWAQAMYLYQSGFRYWFTSDEIVELNSENEIFQMVTIEEQLVIKYFSVPQTREDATHFLQPAEIMDYIMKQSNHKISTKMLGNAMQKRGYEKFRKRDGDILTWVYSVIKNDLLKVEENTRNNREPSISY